MCYDYVLHLFYWDCIFHLERPLFLRRWLILRSPAANLPLCFFGDEKQQKKRKQRNATSTVVSESVPLLKGLGSTTTRCLVGRRLPSFISFVAGVPRPLNSKIVIFSIFGAEGIWGSCHPNGEVYCATAVMGLVQLCSVGVEYCDMLREFIVA